MEPLPRSRLRDDIAERLEQLIMSGTLVARLKEIELAAKLGVSRTPLREALLILERQGLVVSEVNKGFRVAALSETRVRELYPIMGALEALAVRESGERLVARAGELRALNAQLKARRVGRIRHALDKRFHETLWSECANPALVEMLRKLWLQAQRYDGAAERGMANPRGSIRDHAAIVDAIAGGDLDGAARKIEAHWRTGIDVVIGWLRAQRRRTGGTLLALVAVAAVWQAGCHAGPVPAPLPDDPWGYYIDEAAVEQLVVRLSREHRPAPAVFEHVAVIDPNGATARDQTVVVDGGAIRALGTGAAIPPAAIRIDGRGRFLAPGLVDMHVHTNQSNGHFLLDLANGITSVREMNGSPSLLAQRAQARDNVLLIPNLYVAGQILASRPMAWYARVVKTPEEARAAVRDQRAAGYDFIKVHNVVLPEVYDAICAEARAVGLDVVGHIPHDTTVARAIACGQRTFEHFKSYINDRNLQLSTEDYVAATRGAPVWNTPTFYNYRGKARGDDALRLLGLPEMRFVPPRDLAKWRALAAKPPEPVQQNVIVLSKRIFGELRAVGAHFLAGTDSGGGYPYHVPGFSLHEELHIMASLGMSPAEALATATTEPAVAMRRETELGAIAVGKRADLVLLRANPLDSVDALEAIDGVMVRGIWLPRATLDAMLDQLARIWGTGKPRSRAELDAALATLEELRRHGHVLRAHVLGSLRYHLERAGIPTARPLFEGVAPLPPD